MIDGEYFEGTMGQITDFLGRAHVPWLVAAVLLHVGGQVCRGLAWHGVLAASWPGLRRRRVCAWHVCGAGMTGVVSGRGGDLIRVALARRELPRATCPAIAGTLVAEGSFEVLSGIALGLAAMWIGVGSLASPSPLVVAIAIGVAGLTGLAATRSTRIRRVVAEVGRGLRVLRDRRRFLRLVLPWQMAGRFLRLAAIACFLSAFGLPAAPAMIVAACVAQGSANVLPIPGAGVATAGAALLVALPMAAGHTLDAGSIAALAVTQTAVLTAVGLTSSLGLLAVLFRARTPAALVRAARALAPRTADATS
jgi:hypothetical protein